MDKQMKKLAMISALVIAGNVAATQFTPALAEPQNCPSPAPTCSSHDDCDDPNYVKCKICYPNPFGPVCTSNN